jgi:hypothetical protein
MYTTTSTIMLMDDIDTFYRVENGCDDQPLLFLPSIFVLLGIFQVVVDFCIMVSVRTAGMFFFHESSRGHEKGSPNRLYRPRTQGY